MPVTSANGQSCTRGALAAARVRRAHCVQMVTMRFLTVSAQVKLELKGVESDDIRGQGEFLHVARRRSECGPPGGGLPICGVEPMVGPPGGILPICGVQPMVGPRGRSRGRDVPLL